ncbi:MAG TPA: expansin EXLX1 family cellulose-binding protein [Streptosporangiaceae bacterium]
MAHSHRHPRPGRRKLPGWGLGAASACAAAAVVAIAVGISQAIASPACAAVAGPTTPASTAQTSGEATHYVLTPGDGNCSYPGLPNGGLFVALSPSEYAGSAACGSYVEVTGPGGSVTAEVVDQCPPCQAGHVDLSEQAFQRIAPLSAGEVPVTYHTIVDPPLPGALSVLVKTGSNPYYLALLPIGAGNALASVQVSSPAHGWQQLTRTSYGYWLAAAGLGAGPFTVRLTDSAGHQATLTGITLSPGAIQPTSVPMYGTAAAMAPASPAARAKAKHRHRHRIRPTASSAPSQATLPRHNANAVLAASPSPSC